MKLEFNLPEFHQIDNKLAEIRTLAKADPLLTIVKERFLQQITHHLTSLKSAQNKMSYSNNAPQLIDYYMKQGKEHAITLLVFDLAKQAITTDSFKLLSELIVGSSGYRTKEMFILNVSGKRQQTPKAINVEAEMEKMVGEYNKVDRSQKIHPLTKAAFLHYGITSIHPFDDWNGRFARLMLNISLMNSGLLPVLIGQNERITYYECLEKADNGNIGNLVQFLARKELETIDEFMHSAEYLSIKGKIELQKQLENVNGSEKCIVLTEDSATHSLIELLLVSSGFNLKETNVISYEGCSKIASANLFSIFVKEKMPHVKILVHRDRDYLTDSEIEQQREMFSRIDTKLFVTNGTDVESHFLNSTHIAYCLPSIDVATAQKLIDESIDEVFPKSVDFLRKKEFGTQKTESNTHLNKAIEDLVATKPMRFTHGKTTLRVLQYKLNDFCSRKANIEKPTQHLLVPELFNFAKTIWK